jgi:cytochrome c oxidase subunit 3
MTELATEFHPHEDLAHHFSDLEQQKEAATLGMWLFLATEVMLFGSIFLGYTIYRRIHYEPFVAASNHLYISLGTINTVVLLTSSLMMALGVHAAREGNSKWIVRYLLLTIVLGLIFLGIKFTEYYLDYKEKLIPWGDWWERHSPDNRFDHNMQLFFVLYFIMTMLHAIHMVIGMSVLGVIAWFAHKNRFSAKYNTPVDMAGLYWHFVDIVWVFLFPTLYLINPAARFAGH